MVLNAQNVSTSASYTWVCQWAENSLFIFQQVTQSSKEHEYDGDLWWKLVLNGNPRATYVVLVLVHYPH